MNNTHSVLGRIFCAVNKYVMELKCLSFRPEDKSVLDQIRLILKYPNMYLMYLVTFTTYLTKLIKNFISVLNLNLI